MERFDVVVVGAGSAGCVVARRLADRGASLVLLDQGPGLPLPPQLTTVDAMTAFDAPDRFRPDLFAETGPSGRRVPYRQGQGIGGGSTVNTLVATIGDRRDYDRWADDGSADDGSCPSWGWDAVGPYFDRVVEQQPIETARRGPLASAFAEACEQAGHVVGGSSLAVDGRGFLDASLIVSEGRRSSVVDSYLAAAPVGLRIEAGREVRRLVTKGGRVVGVELADGSVIAGDRVVVTAGALGSAELLHRSGLAGPDVGRRVEDHPSFVFTVALDPSRRQPVDPAAAPISGLLRCSSGGAPGTADVMASVMDHVGTGEDGRRYGAVLVALTETVSRGSLTFTDGSGEGDGGLLRFRPGWLTDGDDLVRMRSGVRHIAALLASEPMSSAAEAVFIDDGGTPLQVLSVMSDEELDGWLVSHPGPLSHVGGTCRLGGGTLDEWGRVTTVDGLHVADGSVLPRLPNANPHLPIMAVAEALVARIGD